MINTLSRNGQDGWDEIFCWNGGKIAVLRRKFKCGTTVIIAMK